MNADNKITVFIVSQQFLLRQGIEHSLASVEDIEISGTAEVSDDILSTIDTVSPDVALIDIDGPAESGLTLARKIRQRSPNIGIVLITSNSGDGQLFQALKAQAAGFLNKEVTAEQLVTTVRRVAHGEHPINESLTARPKVAEQVLRQFQELTWRSEAEAFMSPLTQRETGILSYIAQGFPNKQIATELGISEQTIKNHVTSILRKLNANARTEAVVIGIKQGLISIN
ncbi:MAG: response regulator transcription factor [Chloroflexota bacterium]|nr:response regulator transcription factor [Chloroflexota bacterium]